MGKKQNHQWERVIGTAIDREELKRKKRNAAILESQPFLDACNELQIEATRRQASKWARGKGIAFRYHVNHEA